jgi:signal transduction histidine kinase/DNA-binding response OmpR family regulator
VSRGKLWNKAPLQLSLQVKPPWYRSNLAYLTYLVLFLSLAFLYYKITLQRKLAGQEAKRLQDLDDLKSRFITNITHEFRTPLTIILGYLDNLKERLSTKKEIISSLETIEKNSNNLLGLVNQMLDLAKLEQGKLQLNYKNSDAVSYIKHLTNSFLSIAEDHKIKLLFASEQKEIKMDFDAEKLRQIITNLLSNALKFTSEEKKVEITLSQITKKDKPQLKIEVKDQGIGISGKDLNTIFDRFYQAQSDTFKISQGTGIGLALTKELAHLMNGSISVISEIGTGSTFTLLLPITQNAQKTTVTTEDFHATIGKTEVLPTVGISNKAANNHILIVEDNTDIANYISSCLSDSYQITHVLDGSKGLEKAVEQIPDLIISDVMMPVMDGFEMTQKLQQHEATNHIPVIILTSKAMQEDKIEGLESGADAYLTKPFSKKELQIRIANLIAKRKILQERYQTEVVVQQKKEVKASTDKNIIFLNKAIDCIHLFIEDNTFNSEKLAKELGLSDSQLYRKLKAISNTSTAIFIRNIRLEKAKELLQTTDLTISEIAYATGFNDPSWFSKTFKTTFGESPTEIRK